MIGFRYIPNTNNWEFCEYYHQDGDTHWTNPLLTISDTGWIEVHMYRVPSKNKVYAQLTTNSHQILLYHEFDESLMNNTLREIGIYFGGTSASPNNNCIKRERLN